jgi:hypothetical protein
MSKHYMACGSGLGLKVPTELMLTKPMSRYFIAYKAIRSGPRGNLLTVRRRDKKIEFRHSRHRRA